MTTEIQGENLGSSERLVSIETLRALADEALEIAYRYEQEAARARAFADKVHMLVNATGGIDMVDIPSYSDAKEPVVDHAPANVVDITGHIHAPAHNMTITIPKPAIDIATSPESEGTDQEASKRMRGFLKDLTDEQTVDTLKPRQSDKISVIESVVEMNEPLDPREDIEVMKNILSYMYDGLKDKEIADKMGVTSTGSEMTPGNVSVKISQFKKRGGERTSKRKDGKTTSEILTDRILAARKERSGVVELDIPETEGKEPKLSAEELLAALVDEETAVSFKALLEGEKYDSESMSLGKRLLYQLVEKYMPSEDAARRWAGGVDMFHTISYRGLERLSGRSISQSEVPQTLRSLAKYNPKLDEEAIHEYIHTMLAAEYVAKSEKTDVEAVPSTVVSLPPVESSAPVETSKPAPKNTLKLWDIISGYEQATKQEVDEIIEQMLEDAVAKKHIKRVQALSIKADLLNSEEVLDADEKHEMLQHLRQKFREVNNRQYSRLHDTPEFTSYFMKYIGMAEGYGASSIKEIIERLNSNIVRGGKLTRQKFVLDVAAVMQVVFDELDN